MTQTSSVYKDSALNTVTVQAPTTVPSSYLLKWPAAAGSVSQVLTTDAVGNLSRTSPLTSASAFAQGGNTFGAVANLGTNDNFDLRFKTNGATAKTVTNAGSVGIGTTAPTQKLEVAGNVKAEHIVAGGSAPTLVCGAGAGSSPTLCLNQYGSDQSGSIQIQTGSSPSLNGVIATVTFGTPYTTGTNCTFSASSQMAAQQIARVYGSSTTTTFYLQNTGTALSGGGTVYAWTYHCSQ